jgi:arylsulfatase A-like enzyme
MKAPVLCRAWRPFVICPPILLRVAVLFTAFLWLAAQATSQNRQPNIVVILADDLGWGDLGIYGHPKFRTPNLDRMAREGARLTHFYSPTPYCAPSRASLLTGRYPFRHGITGNPAPDAGIDDIGISASEITLGEAFQASGYQTGIIGKWHLGHKPEFFPTRHGFHEYLGILYSNDMRPVQLIEGDKVVEYPVVQATLTRRYTDRALSFIDRNKHRPFFLYFPHAMPHKPLAASEELYRKSDAGLYGDVLAELDWSVGQVLAKLRESGLDDKTLVIFTSDNGPWYGGSTGRLRGMKGTNWEGGLRVPLIARWPGRIPAGHVSNAPAIMMDVFPTTLKAAGILLPTDRTIDGKNLFPLLTSKAASQHEAIFSMQSDQLVSVRGGNWKLHVVPPREQKPVRAAEKWIDPRAPDGVTILAPYEQAHPSEYPGVFGPEPAPAPSLFDLSQDPNEQHNVAAQHRNVVQQLKALCDAAVQKKP